jgi:ABC-type dipeptide/oligopeptide/nickel transport system permease component
MIMFKKRLKNILGFFLFEITLKSVLILFITTFFCSFLLSVAPKENRISILIREDISFEKTKEIKQKKFPESYFVWLKNISRGDLGVSKSGQSVVEEGKQKLITTLTISFISLLLLISLSFIIGINDSAEFKSIVVVIYLVTTLPAFFLGYILIGLINFHQAAFLNYVMAILTLTLSSGIIYEFSKLIKNTMRSEMQKEYIDTARAKGLIESVLPNFGTIQFHAFRNAIIQIFSRISSLLPIIISSSIIIEQVFGIHGLSYMLLDGFTDKDINRILLVILLAVVIVRIGSIVSNFVYILLNPQYQYFK